MNARAQDVVLASENLTQKQEDFARYYVETRNASTAYRLAYNVGRDTLPTTIWSEASRILAHPCVAARVQELRDAAEAHTIIKARELVQDWVDMASVDANEVVQLKTRCCRHCYGVGGRYQWMHEDEFMLATEDYQRKVDQGVKMLTPPDPLGGFDFDPEASPNPRCFKCEGVGLTRVTFTDTDKLSTKARKLYLGAKQTSQGIEVKMVDQHAVRVEIAKVMGLYGKDVTLNPAAAVAPPEDAVDEADAATAYLTMVSTEKV